MGFLDKIADFLTRGKKKVKDTWEQGVKNVTSKPISDYTLLSMPSKVAGTGSKLRDESGKLGNTVANVLTGAASINPLLGGLGVNKSFKKKYYESSRAKTDKEKELQRYGRIAATSLATLPLGGVKGLVSGAAQGAGLNLAGTGINAIKEKRLPTKDEVKEAIVSGAEYAPIFKGTNAVTNSLIKKGATKLPFLKKFTDEALKAPKTFKKAVPYLVKNTAREVAETPAETAIISALDRETGRSDKSYFDTVKNRFGSDLVGNAIFGVGSGVVKTGLNKYKPQIDVAKNKIVETNQKLAEKMPVGMTTKEKSALPEDISLRANQSEIEGMKATEQEILDLNTKISKFEQTSGLKFDDNQKANLRAILRSGGGPEDIINYLKDPKTAASKQTLRQTGLDEVLNPSVEARVKESRILDKPEEFDQDYDNRVVEQLDRINDAETKPTVSVTELKSEPQKDLTGYEIVDKVVNGRLPSKAEIKSIEYSDKPTFIAKVKQTWDGIESEILANKTTVEQFVDYLESGTMPAHLKPIEAKVKRLTDFALVVARERGVELPKKGRTNYWHQVANEQADNYTEKSLGELMLEPAFSKKRTGKLEAEGNYVKDFRSILHLFSEAMGSNDPIETKRRKAILAIKEEASARTDLDKSVTGGMKKPPDLVTALHKATGTKPKFNFETNEKGLIRKGTSWFFRGNNDRARLFGKDYWDKFVMPFRQADIDFNAEFKAESAARKLKPDEVLTMYRKHRAIAINKFHSNVENSKFSQDTKELTNDIYNEQVLSGIQGKGTIEKIMGGIRSQIGRSALGLNISSALMNVLETKRAISLIGTDVMKQSIKEMASGKDLTQKYGIDSAAGTALERPALAEKNRIKSQLSALLEKYDKSLFFMFDASEKAKDNVMLIAFENQGMKKGYQEEDLTRYVLQKFDQYAIKYGKGQDIGLFKSPLAKTLFQFGQYPIKDLVIAWDKIYGAIGNKDVGDRKYLIKYAILSAGQMAIFKALIGSVGFGGQTNTPVDFFTNIASRGVPVSPFVSAVWQLSQTIEDEFSGENENKTDYDKYQANQELIKNASLMSGLPVNQALWKTGRYAQDLGRGEMQTYSGNVANPTTDSLWGKAKGLAFGRSYDPERQRYVEGIQKNQQPSLTAAQSEVFRSLPKDEAKTYYETRKAEDITKGENAKAVKAIQAGKKGKMPALTIPTDKATEKVFNETMSAYIEGGIVPDEAALKYYYFKNNDPKTVDGRTKIVKKIDTIMEDDLLSDEIKAQAIKSSGISDEDFAYYKIASGTDTEKKQLLIEAYDRLKREDFIKLLAQGRRRFGDKQLITSEMYEYLYDMGIITKDEKKGLTALKYDETSEKYYLDRDYELTGEGGYTKSEMSALMKKLYTIFKTPSPFKLSKSKKPAPFKSSVKSKQKNLMAKINARKIKGV